MQLNSIKPRKPHHQLAPKTVSSKSTISTDINQIIVDFKSQEESWLSNKTSKINPRDKAAMYCKIIQECYKNKANQLILCSVLGIPFVQGPASINSLSHLFKPQSLTTDLQPKQHKQSISAKFMKELFPLFKYLKKIRQKEQYYYWMIFHDGELGILNVKLFTKWEFLAIKHANTKAKGTHGSKNSSSSSVNVNKNMESQSLCDEFIEWDRVLVGIFIGNFNKQESCVKDRVNSVIGLLNEKSTTLQSCGLSNKTTKQSFNLTNLSKNSFNKLKKDKILSSSMSGNIKTANQPQILRYFKSPSLKQNPQDYSFHKTNKTTYIVQANQPKKQEISGKSKLSNVLMYKKTQKLATFPKNKI